MVLGCKIWVKFYKSCLYKRCIAFAQNGACVVYCAYFKKLVDLALKWLNLPANGRFMSKSIYYFAMASLLAACSSAPIPKPVQQAKVQPPMPVNHQNQHKQAREQHDHQASSFAVGSASDFTQWLANHPTQAAKAREYEQYLQAHLDVAVPPMHELLTTARSWQACGFERYQVPPDELWAQMLPTIRLYQTLKSRQILPSDTQIRSVYRNPELNRCAGGAAGSKHMTNGAMDIWVPSFADDASIKALQDKLCQFWLQEGEVWRFGLGLYATGAIHLDTQGYRKWGAQFSNESSPCRVLPNKSDR